ncbi:MAG: membrane protease subunit HflK [Limisphaerales bacterium]|jgi:membrane protease subunit HflK
MSDDEKQTEAATPPGEKAPTSGIEVLDDARTRALTEALQSSFKVVRVIMVILAVAFFGSGITKIDNNKQALHLRFGEFKKRLLPGLHWAWPYPIDEIVQIPVNENRTITSDVGWRTEDEETPQNSMSFQPTYDGYTLTGDGNTLHVKAEMNFSLDEKSGDAIKAYEFGFSDVTGFLESVLDNAVYHASAGRSAIDAYTKQSDLRNAIERRVEKTISGIDSDLRIKINSLTLDVTVPLDVKPAFDAFLKVQQESQQKVATAKADAVSAIANALGQAKVIEGGGQTAANILLTSVRAEAKAFAEQRPYYEDNPGLFERRLVAETMQRVLTNAVDVFYLSGRTPRIWLNRTPEKRKLKEGGTP